MRLERLKQQASIRATALGHQLSAWEIGLTRRNRISTCRSCGFYAVVSTAPDYEPMAGTTLTVQCRGRLTRPTWCDAA